MNFNPNIHHRRSIRLRGYDYSQAGLYAITICCQDRAHRFGHVAVGAPLVGAHVNGSTQMILNDAGKMVESEWIRLTERFQNIEFHQWVVMPNHFHAILEIVDCKSAKPTPEQLENRRPQGHAPTPEQTFNQLENGRPQGHAPTANATMPTVADMVDAFKSITTVKYIRGVKTWGWEPFNGKLWQRNYYEHIIRTDESYQRIANYIENNPANWAQDSLNNSNT